ncbi:MAG TPA: tRNA 2-thiouridine(34) synthase MnmA [Caldilineae bacterium]|nr:tRNA 2-thiouridine(34) synthase MnmA [Caldilineae bacterium]
MTRERIVVAMSGGVDSSVAAALLMEQGYEVVGVMLRLWAEVRPGLPSLNRCCSDEAVEDARRVASVLGIPFYLLNVERPFKENVVDRFIAGYASGVTPNPCLYCNRYIRFGRLLNYALGIGATALATGHYARVREAPDGTYQLLRAVDRSKDQSYVLYMVGQRELSHLRFPIGHLTKQEVREKARELGLPVAGKSESQEICFVVDGDYRRFLTDWAPEAVRPGPIVDREGNVLGQHKGLPFYTIGQRRGLGIAAREPLYVLELDVDRNAVVVGTKEELGRDRLTAARVNWIAGHPPEGEITVTAKIRYKGQEVAATVRPLPDDRVDVRFERPLRDITPGQAVVFYQGDVCLGGGIIEPFDRPLPDVL